MDGEDAGVDLDDDEVHWLVTDDQDLFVAVFHKHGQAVHAYLARRGGRQTADDLLGEVWLRAWRSRKSYRSDWPSPRPWLYGIARNTLRAHWRSKVDLPLPVVELTGDPWAAVDVRLDAERLRPALLEALSVLDDEARELLLLIAWERLTPSEVAISLDVVPSTVRSRLHRARSMLQHQLDIRLETNDTPQESRP